MTIVIPVTGTARCGKTTLMDQLSRLFLRDPDGKYGKVTTIDSSEIAKEFLETYMSISPRLKFNKAVKSNRYRQALVDIIKALDSMDIRSNWITEQIINFALDNEDPKKTNVIFVNIREISVITKIVKDVSINTDDYVKCVTLICSRPTQTNFVSNESDSANFIEQANKVMLNYIPVEIPEVRGLGETANISKDDADAYDAYVAGLAVSILDNVSRESGFVAPTPAKHIRKTNVSISKSSK